MPDREEGAYECLSSNIGCPSAPWRRRPGLPLRCPLLHGGEWLQDFRSSFKMLVKDLPVVTWCQQSTKKWRCQDCTTFLNVSTGRGYDRYPSVDWTLVKTGPWLSSMSRELFSPMVPADCDHLSRCYGARATMVGLRIAPAGWFPLPDADVGASGLPPICPPRSPSSMSLEQLWGLGRLLSELTQLCVTAACDRYTRECLCFAKCTTRFSVCDEGHHLLSCFRGAGAHTRALVNHCLG